MSTTTSSNHNSNNNNAPKITPIKYKTILSSEQILFVLSNFVSYFEQDSDYQKSRIEAYDALNQQLKEYLFKNKIYDVKIDYQRYIEKYMNIAKQEIDRMKQLLEIKQNNEIPAARVSTRLKSKRKQEDNEDSDDDDEAFTPASVSQKAWPYYKAAYDVYDHWDTSCRINENLQHAANLMSIDSNNNVNSNQENRPATGNAQNSSQIVNNPSKTIIKAAETKAVETFRTTLRTDALALMNQRKEASDRYLTLMQASDNLLKELAGDIAERKRERAARMELLDLQKQLLLKQLGM